MLTEQAAILIEKLISKGETLAVAESCTGGMLASKITNTVGASQVFLGGVVSYSNQLKCRLLNVSLDTIENFGAVSADCAIEMCQGVLDNLASDHAVSITGIAGPGGATSAKPVGLVYIAIGNAETIEAFEFHFYGTRHEIRRQAVLKAMELLMKDIAE
ncbi:MAG: CinA family protein [Lentisphaeria bacterium]|nr:CinA family protein [Lentisphaeria bacterium]